MSRTSYSSVIFLLMLVNHTMSIKGNTNMIILKSFKYRIYPNKTQELKLFETLRVCKNLYNKCLEEKINLYKTEAKSISAYDQMSNLSSYEIINLDTVYQQVIQNTILKLNTSFQNFFRRLKTGVNPGFPRFKSQDRFNSFCYPQVNYGFRLIDNSHLKLSKIGVVKIKLHREIQGNIKTLTIKRTSSNQWYACFSCEQEVNIPKVQITSKVGIDMGCINFATLSDGVKYDHPHYYRKMQANLKLIQQKYDKLKLISHGNKNKIKTKAKLNKVHAKVTNQRNDFLHKLSTQLVKSYDLICIEKLDIKSMFKTGYKNLNKSIADGGWNQFSQYLTYKAAYAGKQVIAVDPAYTSQICSHCGTHVKLRLNQRMFRCPDCHLLLDRDVNASLNILNLGTNQHDITSRWQLIVDQVKVDQLANVG